MNARTVAFVSALAVAVPLTAAAQAVPRQGVQYFTSGGGGALRRGDIRVSPLTAAGFDQDTHFLLVEIAGDHFYFQAISRTGQTVDLGEFERVSHAEPAPVLRR